MGDVTQGALAKEAADKQGELDANLGKPTHFTTGATGIPTAEAPLVPAAPAYHPDQSMSMRDHLKSILGVGGMDPSPNGGMSREAGALKAVDQGIADANSAKP